MRGINCFIYSGEVSEAPRLLLGNHIVDLYIWESLDSLLIPDNFQAEFWILNLQ